MQENDTLARPYAVAAFKQAREQGAFGGWSDALRTLGSVVADSRIQAIARNPKVDAETLTRLVLDIGGDSFFDIARNFVRVLVDAERLLLAPEIFMLFDRLRASAEGSAQVLVTTAFGLSAEDEERIAESLARHFKRSISMEVVVDESLIGGVVVRSGDQVLDASVKGQLEQLALRING